MDCDLLSKVYINLIDQKEPKLDFRNSNFSQKISSEINENSKNIYFNKVVELSEDELNAHRLYLEKSLKKNFF